MPQHGYHECCCYHIDPQTRREYLRQAKVDVHTKVVSTASQTTLKQTFVNPFDKKDLEEVRYVFPLYDGASVVRFECRIGERTIYGLVKEKVDAKKTYQDAKKRGEQAALLEQLPEMSDVFTTTVANIPAGGSMQVTLTYVQELKHDGEVDGIRLTIPTHIAPRYSSSPNTGSEIGTFHGSEGMSITVDVNMPDGVPVRKVISPSHPIEVSLGVLSTNREKEEPKLSQASATLALGTAQLDKDFVLQVVANDIGVPRAILETHPTLENQRALMTTLVPKFRLKAQKPEIIFIADRSGSMQAEIPTLISALQVFLKSIPLGCTFNICSFGSSWEFLWPQSKSYGQDTLDEAMKYINKFDANFGGTETLLAVKAAIERREQGVPTELMLLTDGDIWDQNSLFEYIRKETDAADIRLFSIGIGGDISSALVEGVARAGRGFAQMVANHEKLEAKVVRMLKGALTPHIKDYRLEVKYEDDSVESVAESFALQLKISDEGNENEDSKGDPAHSQRSATEGDVPQNPVLLYDPNIDDHGLSDNHREDDSIHLPELDRPKLLQTPHEIPSLFPFNRTSVYLLMSPQRSHLRPKSVTLKANSPQGPLLVEIPVEIHTELGEMIHQLAARKAIQELEEGQGWLTGARTTSGELLREKHPSEFKLLQKREAIRLGVEFQVGSKYCSFVAVEGNEATIAKARRKALGNAMKQKSTTHGSKEEGDGELEDWELLSPEAYPPVRKILGGAKRARNFVDVWADEEEVEKDEDEDEDEDLGFVMDMVENTLVDYEEVNDSSMVHSRRRRGFGLGGAKAARKVLCESGEEDEEKEEEEEEEADSKRGSESESLLQLLIRKQTFEGRWPHEELPWEAMKIEKAKVDSVIERLQGRNAELTHEQLADMVATVLVVIFLQQKMTDEEETWELVVEKANDWLEGVAHKTLVEGIFHEGDSLLSTV